MGKKAAWNKGLTKTTDMRVAKMAAALTGFKQSRELVEERKATKAKHDAALTKEERSAKYARKMSPEHEANFRASVKGKKQTAKRRAAMSAAQRGVPETEESKNAHKMAFDKYYAVEHPERSEKISNRLKQYWASLSKEEIDIIRESRKGRKHNFTEEDIQRRRDFLIARNKDPEFIKQNRKKLIGRVWTSDQRNNARIATLKYVEEHPEVRERQRNLINMLREQGRVGFPNAGSESYPEKLFRTFLESFGFVKGKNFFQEYHIGKYSLDFALPNLKIDIEIDGSQHQKIDAIKHDLIRDTYLKSLGWSTIRFPAKTINKNIQAWNRI